MLKQRGIKAIIISLLVLLSSTCFSLLLVNGVYKHNQTQNNQVVMAYSGGTGTKADPFLIASKEDLDSLNTAVRGGTSYFLHHFKLTADIDCGGATMVIGGGKVNSNDDISKVLFQGTLDGDGYTISKFVMGKALDASAIYGGPGVGGVVVSETYRGLFVCGDNAIIKNIKFSNFTFETLRLNDPANNGIIAYGENALLANCIFEDYKFTRSTRETTAKLTGSKASFCLLESADIADGITVTFAGGEVTSCVSKNSSVTGATCSSAYNASVLGDSYVAADDSKNWFYSADCNGGWPYLTKFMSFWFVKVDDGNHTYTVNFPTAPFKLPADNICVASSIGSLTDSTLTLYSGKEISAYNLFEGKYFTSWKRENISLLYYLFTAQFETEQYTINFASVTFNSTTFAPSPGSVTVSYGTAISFSGTTYTIGGSTTVSYTLDSIYEISSDGLSGVTSSGKVIDLGENGATKTVTPTISFCVKTLTFGDATGASKDATSCSILRGRGVTVNLGITTCSYTFLKWTGSVEEWVTVTYTAGDLYEFTGPGWTSDDAVTSDTTITPTLKQVYVIIQFTTTTGAGAITPDNTSEIKVYFNDGAYLYSGIDGQLVGNELQFSFKLASNDEIGYVKYVIPGLYNTTTNVTGQVTGTLVLTPVLATCEYDLGFGEILK